MPTCGYCKFQETSRIKSTESLKPSFSNLCTVSITECNYSDCKGKENLNIFASRGQPIITLRNQINEEKLFTEQVNISTIGFS